MFGNLTGPTLLVIVFIVLLLFGAPKLPALAKSLGQSMKILRKEVTTDEGKRSGNGSDDAEDSAARSDAAPWADTAARPEAGVSSTAAAPQPAGAQDDELARAQAEAAAARAEAEALRAEAAKRAEGPATNTGSGDAEPGTDRPQV